MLQLLLSFLFIYSSKKTQITTKIYSVRPVTTTEPPPPPPKMSSQSISKFFLVMLLTDRQTVKPMLLSQETDSGSWAQTNLLKLL